jgi:hypothetical protein
MIKVRCLTETVAHEAVAHLDAALGPPQLEPPGTITPRDAAATAAAPLDHERVWLQAEVLAGRLLLSGIFVAREAGPACTPVKVVTELLQHLSQERSDR